MGWLASLFGGSKVISDPVDAIGNALDKLFTSDEERAQANFVMEKLRQRPAIIQTEINKLEAQHRSMFVAGWRPFLGWVCGLGLANCFLINPWIQWITGSPGPQLPLSVMMDLVVALLGLGILRTTEKIKGVTK